MCTKEGFFSAMYMKVLWPKTVIQTIVSLLALLLLCEISAASQQLSLRHYDVSDGLAHGVVTSICQDNKGYLWISTFEGLSRFDGYRFVNYTTQDGLPNALINHVIQDRHGRIWLATNGDGVALLQDELHNSIFKPPATSTQKSKFISFRIADTPNANKVNRILIDSQDNLWCLTDFGIYCAKITQQSLDFRPVIASESFEAYAILEDSQGRLWFGLTGELIEINQGQIVRRIPNPEGDNIRLTDIIEDSPGRLLVSTIKGLFEFLTDSTAAKQEPWRKLPLILELPQYILTMRRDRTGSLWCGTTNGLLKYSNGKQSLFSLTEGQTLSRIRALVEDREGNLWAGSDGTGVYKLKGEAIVSYTQSEGVPFTTTLGVLEDEAGRIQVSLGNSLLDVVVIDGTKITLQRQPNIPPCAARIAFIHMNQKSWQVSILPATLFNQASPHMRLRNGQKLNVRDLLSAASNSTWVFVLEDTSGKLWIHKDFGKLHYADPSQPGKLNLENVPGTLFRDIRTLIDDGRGSIWIGGIESFGRLRQGQYSTFEPQEGLPENDVRALFIDSRGWLWIGTRNQGVSVTKDPGAEHLQFINYSAATNLSSNTVWTIAEDDYGKMYFGTGKGLDQFDLNTGQWRHYAAKDGLPGDRINQIYKDSHGLLWISTIGGVARFNPQAERASGVSAPIYLSHVQIAGEALTLPETGISTLEQGELSSERNNLLLEYVALSFQGENTLRYQYMLEGVDTDWSAPTDSRSVNYARLTPGAYRFLVRAIDKNGTTSPAPAILQFTILSPVWQRWWFLTMGALVCAAFAYALYRYRINQLLRLEHVRMRIATDLHDDIGSSLSQISILSEIAQVQIERRDEKVTEPLAVIAQTSRELIDSMSDIVWAINPKRDHLRDLVQRMRQFATDTLTALDIDFDFLAPDEEFKTRLGTDVRREIFLIFKEAIHNLTTHSHCSAATIEISLTGNWLLLKVSDNGSGFNATVESTGHGLFSMRQRAERIGGNLDVASVKGHGSTITLKAPVK